MKQLSMNDLPWAERSTVLLGFRPGERQMDLIFELADAWGWNLVGLENLEGRIPDNLALDGALITGLPTGPLARKLRKRHCPAVRLGRFRHPQDHELPAVLPDLAAAGRMAADHFVERRFKELGIVTYEAGEPTQHYHPLWRLLRACPGVGGPQSLS